MDGGGNRFFDDSHADDPTSGSFIATTEVPEPPDLPVQPELREHNTAPEPVLLECIDARWLKAVTAKATARWLDLFSQAPLAVVELKTCALPRPADDLLPGDIALYSVNVSRRTDEAANAISYGGLFSGGTPVTVTIEPIPRRHLSEKVFGPTGWFAEAFAGTPKLKQWRQRLQRPERCGGVAIYDVGQGACQAILNEQGVPIVYVDFGGGVLGNAKTFPANALSFCFGERPPIVLSHWDWDHWSSAKRFPLAMEVQWLAPPVPDKFVQSAFAAELRARGLLHIWPSSGTEKSRHGALRLERCAGRTANDSGIAARVYPHTRSRTSCLLPGDADYRYVPSVRSGAAFSRLAITHHGGRLHSAVIPVPSRHGVSVCSVGAGNSYQHPFLDTFDAHTQRGWALPLVTGLTSPRPSNLLLPWDGAARFFTGQQYGAHCELCARPRSRRGLAR